MCIEACDNSLERLNLDYLDCYLIHAPFCKDLRLEQWKALCDLKKEGKTRTIGVSNYSQLHIQEIINEGLEVPEYNQIELHPWCQKEELVSFLNEQNIKVVAYSSLVPLEGWRAKPNQASAKSQSMKEDGAKNSSPFILTSEVKLIARLKHFIPRFPAIHEYEKIWENTYHPPSQR
mgnify:CR=1 FL=1